MKIDYPDDLIDTCVLFLDLKKIDGKGRKEKYRKKKNKKTSKK
jgi:hypothetical protein